MGQPNECSCQCGIEVPKKYTCYNGFCVEDELGEYNEPTCSGNCPQPTQYACVSGFCIPTIGGAYNNPFCNGGCPPMPTKRYSCVTSTCVQVRGGSYYEPTCSGACPPRSIDYSCSLGNCIHVPGGPFKNDPTCAGFCDPVIEFRYDCEDGQCIQKINGRYVNDPTCGGNCGDKRYKCQDGQCVQAADGTYINDPTCNNECGLSSSYYLLVNCQDENETLVITAPSGSYTPPFNQVWKIDTECWRMVGETEEESDIALPDTRTPGCDSCNNGVCCFEVRQCTDTNNYNCVNGECVVDASGPYIGDPTCGGGENCDQHYWKICVSGLNPTSCKDYVGKVLKITDCDDPLVMGDSGPPCSPAPGWMSIGYPCQCCFLVINPIPEDPEATYHNLVNVYLNCCECNPCSEEKTCNPGETFVGDCNQCDCVCLDPPCGEEPPETGACCTADCDAIACLDGVTQAQCAEEGGEFYPGLSCNEVSCEAEPCNPQTGECCGGYECDGFGNCIPVAVGMTLEQCQSICFSIEE